MIGYINDLVYVCGPTPLQAGVAKGIKELTQPYYKALCDEYFQKRETICDTLTKVGLTPNIPQGSYYVLADASMLPGETSKEKSMYLLEKTGVATVGGSAFYASSKGENQIRVCFAKSNEVLEEACQRLMRL
jgi:aminotransferase